MHDVIKRTHRVSRFASMDVGISFTLVRKFDLIRVFNNQLNFGLRVANILRKQALCPRALRITFYPWACPAVFGIHTQAGANMLRSAIITVECGAALMHGFYQNMSDGQDGCQCSVSICVLDAKCICNIFWIFLEPQYKFMNHGGNDACSL